MGGSILKSGFFVNNRKILREHLRKGSLVILHSNDEMPRNGDQFYKFRQDSDFFYLTGIEQEQTILILCPDHENVKLREIVFIRKPDETLEIWEGYKLSKEEARNKSGVNTVYFLHQFDSVVRELILSSSIIYFTQREFPKIIPEFPDRNLRYFQNLKNDYPNISLNRLAPLLTRQRLIKTEEELELMKSACQITNNAFDRVLKYLVPGVNEYMVEAHITYEFNLNGVSSHAYHPIIASGKRACVLHYTDNNRICEDGDLVLMDFGAEYENYAADCSRTLPVNGKFDQKQTLYYNAVLRVFKKLKKLYVPGNTINIVNDYANQWMEKEMIDLGLFSQEDVNTQSVDSPLYKKYFMHGTAHFIGLDVHDVGDKNTKFEKGMVLTCEPGLYVVEENIGIRIENDIVIDEKPIDLMCQIPIEIEEIELLMKK